MVVTVDIELNAESRLDMDAAITAAAIIPINPGIAKEEAKSRIIVLPLSKSRPP